ncbi:MAG TPA: pyridoxal phosphate-dependent aminotransferase [Methylomirabilota bacterium]|jgi:aspartate aminotransferase|nr:pyridoxal phosphate-dependent aminotransferase [Methylomirabilota bacterium]
MLAERARRLTPSPTLVLSARARALRAQGIDVLSFTAGEPDFDTPERVKEAAVRAIRDGQTKYTDAGGIPELKSAICAKLKRDSGLAYESSEVIASVGAKHTLYNVCAVLVDPGDEVIVPAPYWVSYTEQVRLCEGVPVVVGCDEPRGFQLDLAALRGAVTPRTKLLLLNTPNNPTGAVYPRADLERVAALALEHGFYVVSDECYDALSYEGRVASIAALGPEIKARTIVVNTCSKTYAMTGWRLGFAAGPREIVKAMTDLQGQCTSNPTSIAQWAAVEALGGPQDEVAKMAGEFDQRRRVIVAGLNRIPGWRCPMPPGAFYAFPDVSGLFGRRFDGQVLRGSADVTAFLLDAARVAVVPGADFGSDRHLRISYACGLEQIREGLARIEAACAGLEG